MDGGGTATDATGPVEGAQDGWPVYRDGSLVVLVSAVLDVPTGRLHVLPKTSGGVTPTEQKQSERPQNHGVPQYPRILPKTHC